MANNLFANKFMHSIKYTPIHSVMFRHIVKAKTNDNDESGGGGGGSGSDGYGDERINDHIYKRTRNTHREKTN